ncbi:DnaJ domain-containing protein [Neolewinella lacunae]|uniref:DnaJ domain-containing protein n=1 Tax=Neolewinella lacunae TaxID=1517758 RepID=A0A923PLX5_9BACT|nr:DnaJ domain-containing protein [Neolewinella lacunae]MBC6992932.1 DnaJ domain-containing protein [Neolewinella lacunae]MDN3633704.1 DnaJ domain-containing protein [Neolewinella lacunae]
MDIATARKILNVSQESSFDDIRLRYRAMSKKYHPDNPRTGDNNTFLTVSAAYTILQAGELGISRKEDIKDDMEQALSVRDDIEAYLEEVEDKYEIFKEDLKIHTLEAIRKKINSATGTSNLKKIIKKDIADILTDTKIRLKHHLKELEDSVKRDNSDFLFRLFKDMYVERQKYWLLTLYKNPVFVGEVTGVVTTFLIKELPAIREAYPDLVAVFSIWWLPLAIIALGSFILLVQFYMLNPKTQFVPPSFSLGGLHQLVTGKSENVGSTAGEIATGGAVMGALAGSLVLPGVGTLIGGVLGSLFGLGGKSLQQIKDEIYNGIEEDIESMFDQLDSIIKEWCKDSKNRISKAAFESFHRNVVNISGFLKADSKKVLLLTEGKKNVD